MLGVLTFEQTRLVSKFCSDILSLDEHIVFVCVINRHGRHVDSHYRGDSPFSDLTKNEIGQVYMQRMLQTQLIKDFDDKISRLQVAIMEREFCTECVFPFYDGILFVVFNSANQIQDITGKITKLIKDFNFGITTTGVSC